MYKASFLIKLFILIIFRKYSLCLHLEITFKQQNIYVFLINWTKFLDDSIDVKAHLLIYICIVKHCLSIQTWRQYNIKKLTCMFHPGICIWKCAYVNIEVKYRKSIFEIIPLPMNMDWMRYECNFIKYDILSEASMLQWLAY